MAMEDPEEEEEQEEPAKVVTEEFNNLSDQEEPTKQEKKSDQTEPGQGQAGSQRNSRRHRVRPERSMLGENEQDGTPFK
jgi:hypothetical protein